MSARQRGFGLMEALLALALGLMVLAAAGQVLFSGQQLWRVQGALARLQEDAMLVLQRLALDIRMTASFGCLSRRPSSSTMPARGRRSPTPCTSSTSAMAAWPGSVSSRPSCLVRRAHRTGPCTPTAWNGRKCMESVTRSLVHRCRLACAAIPIGSRAAA
ncbi:hypothetical protein GKC70_19825 [Pseudomonas sp. REB1044]